MLIDKPWGNEEVLEINEKYVVKRLTMRRGHRCSLQYHNKKQETIYVLCGKLKIEIGGKERVFEQGESITIFPKMLHRMSAVEDSIYLEMSTPEMNDVVRLEDDYQRM